MKKSIFIIICLSAVCAFCMCNRKPDEGAVVRIDAICIGDDVRIRRTASVDGAVVGKCSYGTALTILTQASQTAVVGEMTNCWYYISTEDGLTGWMFGSFIATRTNRALPEAVERRFDENDMPLISQLWEKEWLQTNVASAMRDRRYDVMTARQTGYTSVIFYREQQTIVYHRGFDGIVYEYNRVERLSSNSVRFLPANITVAMFGSDGISNISVSLPYRGRKLRLAMADSPELMRAYVEREYYAFCTNRLAYLAGDYAGVSNMSLKIKPDLGFTFKAPLEYDGVGRLKPELHLRDDQSALIFNYWGPTRNRAYMWKFINGALVLTEATTNHRGDYEPLRGGAEFVLTKH